MAWAILTLGFAVRAFAAGCLGEDASRPPPRVLPVRIDPNRAGVADLQALPGIGAGRAEAIVLDRVRHGPFLRADDLDRVDGIGPATVDVLRPFLLLPEILPEAQVPR